MRITSIFTIMSIHGSRSFVHLFLDRQPAAERQGIIMLKELVEQKWMMGIGIFLLVRSIFLLIMIGALYQNLISETENMSATTNKLLKQCKLKFANCYRMNSGVANISVFVDKFLNRLSLGKLSFRMLYHMSGQLMLLSVFFAGLGACIAIVDGAVLGEILPYYIVSLFGLYLYFSISSMVDVKGKIGILKVNLMDYLENHMVNRLEIPEEEEKDIITEALQPDKTKKPAVSAKSILSQMEEEELEDLLKELLA